MLAKGEFALVFEYMEKALGRPSIFITEVDLYFMLADTAVQMHDQKALERYTPLLEERAKQIDHQLYLGIANRAWGVLHQLNGEFDEAYVRLGQAEELFRGQDVPWQLGRTLAKQGHLAAAQGNTQTARGHYSAALALFEQLGAAPDAERVRELLTDVTQ